MYPFSLLIVILSLCFIYSSSQKSKKCNVISASSSLRTTTTGGGSNAEVAFANIGDARIEVYWMSEGGKEHPMGLLEPEDELSFSSFGGHAFRLRLLSSSDVIFEVIVPEEKQEITYNVGEGCSDTPSIFDDSNINFDDYKFSSFRSFDFVEDSEAVLSAMETSPCKDIGLSDWISRKLKVPGYHVMCLSTPKGKRNTEGSWALDIEAWRDGHLPVNQKSRQIFTGNSLKDLRGHLETLLAISISDSYMKEAAAAIRAQALKKGITDGSGHAWTHLPQQWQMFDTNRNQVSHVSQIMPSSEMPSLCLVFEGGAFVYPGIDLGYTRKITTDDIELELVTLSMRPLVISIDGFLQSSEYGQIVDTAKPHMQESPVSLMDKDKGRKATDFRTSQLVFLDSKKHPFLSPVDRRVANLTGCPVENQEQVQVLKYIEGQYYLPHLDYWDPTYYQDPDVVMMSRGGHKNRLSTVFWYLSDCEGGYTAFPDAPIQQDGVSQVLFESEEERRTGRKYVSKSSEISQIDGTMSCPYGLRVPPRKGRAILFYSLLPNGKGDHLSSHSACAVTGGTKWAANKWVWNRMR